MSYSSSWRGRYPALDFYLSEMSVQQLETFDRLVDDLGEVRGVIKSARRYLESGQLSIPSLTIPAYLDFSIGVLRFVKFNEEDEIHDWYVYFRDKVQLNDSVLKSLAAFQGIQL